MMCVSLLTFGQHSQKSVVSQSKEYLPRYLWLGMNVPLKPIAFTSCKLMCETMNSNWGELEVVSRTFGGLVIRWNELAHFDNFEASNWQCWWKDHNKSSCRSEKWIRESGHVVLSRELRFKLIFHLISLDTHCLCTIMFSLASKSFEIFTAGLIDAFQD